MVRVSSPAELRPWSELTAKMVMGVVPGLVMCFCEKFQKTREGGGCPKFPAGKGFPANFDAAEGMIP